MRADPPIVLLAPDMVTVKFPARAVLPLLLVQLPATVWAAPKVRVPELIVRLPQVVVRFMVVVPVETRVVFPFMAVVPPELMVPVKLMVPAPVVVNLALAAVPAKVIPFEVVMVPVVEFSVATPVPFVPPVMLIPAAEIVQVRPVTVVAPVLVELPVREREPDKVSEPVALAAQVTRDAPVLVGAGIVSEAADMLPVPFNVIVCALAVAFAT